MPVNREVWNNQLIVGDANRKARIELYSQIACKSEDLISVLTETLDSKDVHI